MSSRPSHMHSTMRSVLAAAGIALAGIVGTSYSTLSAQQHAVQRPPLIVTEDASDPLFSRRGERMETVFPLGMRPFFYDSMTTGMIIPTPTDYMPDSLRTAQWSADTVNNMILLQEQFGLDTVPSQTVLYIGCLENLPKYPFAVGMHQTGRWYLSAQNNGVFDTVIQGELTIPNAIFEKEHCMPIPPRVIAPYKRAPLANPRS